MDGMITQILVRNKFFWIVSHTFRILYFPAMERKEDRKGSIDHGAVKEKYCRAGTARRLRWK
jgi:hypothetical protein